MKITDTNRNISFIKDFDISKEDMIAFLNELITQVNELRGEVLDIDYKLESLGSEVSSLSYDLDRTNDRIAD